MQEESPKVVVQQVVLIDMWLVLARVSCPRPPRKPKPPRAVKARGRHGQRNRVLFDDIDRLRKFYVGVKLQLKLPRVRFGSLA